MLIVNLTRVAVGCGEIRSFQLARQDSGFQNLLSPVENPFSERTMMFED